MYEIVYEFFNKNKKIGFVVILFLIVSNAFFFLSFISQRKSELYFLSVGQGDAQYIRFDSGARIMIDAGPQNGAVLDSLSKIVSVGDRTIDLIFISHPEADHIGGLGDVLYAYSVGAVAYSGREGTSQLWRETKKILEQKGIKLITISKGDVIRIGNSAFRVLSPDISTIDAKKTNDTSLVLELSEKDVKTLFVGDIGREIETSLVQTDLSEIDILKVAHHGSKFSSSKEFLDIIRPEVAVIEVGKNSYGHPTNDVLSRLQDVGSAIFRTDIDGTISVDFLGEGVISIFKSK